MFAAVEGMRYPVGDVARTILARPGYAGLKGLTDDERASMDFREVEPGADVSDLPLFAVADLVRNGFVLLGPAAPAEWDTITEAVRANGLDRDASLAILLDDKQPDSDRVEAGIRLQHVETEYAQLARDFLALIQPPEVP